MKLRPSSAWVGALCRRAFPIAPTGPRLPSYKKTDVALGSTVIRTLFWSSMLFVFAVLFCTTGCIFSWSLLLFTIFAHWIFFPCVLALSSTLHFYFHFLMPSPSPFLPPTVYAIIPLSVYTSLLFAFPCPHYSILTLILLQCLYACLALFLVPSCLLLGIYPFQCCRPFIGMFLMCGKLCSV